MHSEARSASSVVGQEGEPDAALLSQCLARVCENEAVHTYMQLIRNNRVTRGNGDGDTDATADDALGRPARPHADRLYERDVVACLRDTLLYLHTRAPCLNRVFHCDPRSVMSRDDDGDDEPSSSSSHVRCANNDEHGRVDALVQRVAQVFRRRGGDRDGDGGHDSSSSRPSTTFGWWVMSEFASDDTSDDECASVTTSPTAGGDDLSAASTMSILQSSFDRLCVGDDVAVSSSGGKRTPSAVPPLSVRRGDTMWTMSYDLRRNAARLPLRQWSDNTHTDTHSAAMDQMMVAGQLYQCVELDCRDTSVMRDFFHVVCVASYGDDRGAAFNRAYVQLMVDGFSDATMWRHFAVVCVGGDGGRSSSSGNGASSNSESVAIGAMVATASLYLGMRSMCDDPCFPFISSSSLSSLSSPSSSASSLLSLNQNGVSVTLSSTPATSSLERRVGRQCIGVHHVCCLSAHRRRGHATRLLTHVLCHACHMSTTAADAGTATTPPPTTADTGIDTDSDDGGYRYAVLQADPPGVPLYERLGFDRHARIRTWDVTVTESSPSSATAC